jgi:hypothetical protein
MAPGTIVRYTKDSGGFRWDQVGVDVDTENPLEVVAPDVADLVDGDPSIPLEKYPAGDVNTDISIVDGLDIAPNSVAADSLQTEQALIGSGYQNPKPEDGTEGIQAAIDALPSDGGVVHLQSGRYDVNNNDPYQFPVHITKPNVAIIGEGWQSEIYLPDGSTDAANGGEQGARIIHDGGKVTDTNPDYNDGTVLMNFAVDGNQQNNGGTGDGDNISDAHDGHNINLNGRYNLVTNVKSVNATGDGVELISFEDPSTCQFSIVTNNLFINNYEQDMHAHGAWNTVWAGNVCYGEKTNSCINLFSDHTDTKNNIFANNYLGSSGFSGAELYNVADGRTAKNIRFIGNIVENHPSSGVTVRDDADGVASSDGIYIVNNTIRGNAPHGIQAKGANNLIIRNNDIMENDVRGVALEQRATGEHIRNTFVRDNYIYNNNRTDSNGDGVYVRVDGQELTNVRIHDNTILADSSPLYRHGVFIGEVSAGAYEDVFIEQNWVKGWGGYEAVKDATNSALKRDNHNAFSDYVSSPPSSVSPYNGLWYYDDGTNTASGTQGKRVYDGSAWQDAWTL